MQLRVLTSVDLRRRPEVSSQRELVWLVRASVRVQSSDCSVLERRGQQTAAKAIPGKFREGIREESDQLGVNTVR